MEGKDAPVTGAEGRSRTRSVREGRGLRMALDPGGSFAHVAELVPWRGALADDAGSRVRALADELGAGPSVRRPLHH